MTYTYKQLLTPFIPILFLLSTSLAGCLKTPIPNEPIDEAVQALALSNDQPVVVKIEVDAREVTLGHQYVFFLIPFGDNGKCAEELDLIRTDLTRLLNLNIGVRRTYVSPSTRFLLPNSVPESKPRLQPNPASTRPL